MNALEADVLEELEGALEADHEVLERLGLEADFAKLVVVRVRDEVVDVGGKNLSGARHPVGEHRVEPVAGLEDEDRHHRRLGGQVRVELRANLVLELEPGPTHDPER